jgi:glutaredoxin 3
MSAAGPPQRTPVTDGVPRITMYTTASCPYCIQAERFLKAKGVVAISKIRVDLEPALRMTMVERTGRRTVPQIYIGDVHVGGYQDLVALDHAGGLMPLLAEGDSPPEAPPGVPASPATAR